ncbi:MAG: crossover junction endodeoxyribonuclease RuvC [Bacteroidales bacterium]|jgi:crossover junction endodeoxyribonuclease RuvC|nr:crossover junction endodeoxyribonuclease RuvC [Bacteroidales bacterium]
MNNKPLRILGIDPGNNITGYGLVEIINNKPVIVDMGKISPKKGMVHYERIKVLHEEALKLMEKYHPDVMAIEAPFYGKDIQAMLKLGRAQGVIMVAALINNIPIYEYAPLLVKQSITGMGRASKEQVAYFLQKVYNLTQLPETMDITDAIAVAICHFAQQSKPRQKSEFKNWGDFVRKNPERIK